MNPTLLGYLSIAASSAAVYLFIVVGFRLFGKKELAQLSLPDLIFVLLISNSVQNAMVGSDSSLQGGLVAASTLFILNYTFKRILYKYAKVQKLVDGEPIILIYKGKVNEKNLHQTKISINELMETVREHGTATIEEVDLAMLEADGNISVLSNSFNKRSVQVQRIKRKKKITTTF